MKNHPNITFGSYPSWSGQHYRTKVTFEGENEEEVSRARSDMEELKPVKFDPKPTENAWEKVQQFLQDTADSHMTEVVEGSLKVVEECFARYSHPRVHSKVGEYTLVFKCSCQHRHQNWTAKKAKNTKNVISLLLMPDYPGWCTTLASSEELCRAC